MRKRCFVCEKRPPRLLETRIGYTHAVDVPVFCSVRCAADWGLLRAGIEGEGDIHWCESHGWYTGETAYDGCPECVMENWNTEGDDDP